LQPGVRLKTSAILSQMTANPLLAVREPDLARRLLSKPQRCGPVRKKPPLSWLWFSAGAARMSRRRVGLLRAVERQTFILEQRIMASRHQDRGSWNVSGASRFLWTDVGALFGLIAVAGFAVYRNFF
jgi:hypothetical protein